MASPAARGEVEPALPPKVRAAIEQAIERAAGGKSAEVSVCFSALEARDVVALALALDGDARFRAVNVAGNAAVGPGGARALASLLRRNDALTALNVAGCRFGCEGAKFLAEALADNDSLTRLTLSGNEVGSRGAAALASALEKNAALQELWLEGNEIEAAGARALAAALAHNRTLTCLGLGGNRIGPDGASALVTALDHNSTLVTLRLGDSQQLGVELEADLFDRLRVNSLARTVPSWAVSAAARIRACAAPGALLPPRAAAAGLPDVVVARLAVQAFGDELVPSAGWRTPGGHARAVRLLLILADAAVRAALGGGSASSADTMLGQLSLN